MLPLCPAAGAGTILREVLHMPGKAVTLMVLVGVVGMGLIAIGGCPRSAPEATEVADLPPEIPEPEPTAEPEAVTETEGGATPQVATQVAKFDWTASPTFEDIPAGPISGMLNGRPFIAQTVRMERDDENTYLLTISNKRPEDPDDPLGVISGDDGWELTFTAPEGEPVRLLWAVADPKRGIQTEHVYYWYAQGQGQGPMSVNYPWGAALEITEWKVHEPEEGTRMLGSVRGRVLLVMDDEAKSWVGGEFEAPYYEW